MAQRSPSPIPSRCPVRRLRASGFFRSTCLLNLSVAFHVALTPATVLPTAAQCRFDPSGYFYINGTPAEEFAEISHILLLNQSAQGFSRPVSGLYTRSGEVYTFATLTSDSAAAGRRVFIFTTATIKGVRYAFSGRFLAPCDYLKSVKNPREVVAEGQLVKQKDGHQVAEAAVQFTYSAWLAGAKDTDLLLATDRDDLAAAKAALARGANVDASDPHNGTTVLQRAVQWRNQEMVKTLIAAGARVNTSGWQHALVYAADLDDGMVELLLAAGADPGALPRGWTPLLPAVTRARSAALVKVLIRARADVNGRDGRNSTPLMLAARISAFEMVDALIAAGADLNAKDEDENTALRWAVSVYSLDMVKRLLRAGAMVDVKEKDGWTPLMEAALNGSIEIVKALIAAGADLNIRNKSGETALTIALRSDRANRDQVAELLRQAGAKP